MARMLDFSVPAPPRPPEPDTPLAAVLREALAVLREITPVSPPPRRALDFGEG